MKLKIFIRYLLKKRAKIEKLREVKFMEDDQLLTTYLADEGPFYYPNFKSKEENKPLPMEVNNLSDSNNELSSFQILRSLYATPQKRGMYLINTVQ